MRRPRLPAANLRAEIARELTEARADADPLMEEIVARLSWPGVDRMWALLARRHQTQRERGRDRLVGKQIRRGPTGESRERLVAYSPPPGWWVHSFLGAVKAAYALPAYYRWTS